MSVPETVDVYFDYVSPFAYLAAEVLPRHAARLGVELRWKPIQLLALGNYADGLPYSPLKARYVAVDAARQAEYHGVPIQPPRPHPVGSEPALLVATAALGDERFPELHRALFRAAWRDRRDFAAPEVLEDCIRSAGGPVDGWRAGAAAPATAERLREQTAEAEGRGVFGVPSFVLGDELFWGLDCLPVLEWRLDRIRGGS